MYNSDKIGEINLSFKHTGNASFPDRVVLFTLLNSLYYFSVEFATVPDPLIFFISFIDFKAEIFYIMDFLFNIPIVSDIRCPISLMTLWVVEIPAIFVEEIIFLTILICAEIFLQFWRNITRLVKSALFCPLRLRLKLWPDFYRFIFTEKLWIFYWVIIGWVVKWSCKGYIGKIIDPMFFGLVDVGKPGILWKSIFWRVKNCSMISINLLISWASNLIVFLL